MAEVFNIFRVVVGFIGLGLGSRVELLCPGAGVRWIREAVLSRSYLRDAKRILENEEGCLG